MKKYLSILVLVAGVFMLTGCESNDAGTKKEENNTKTMTCTRKATIAEGVDADLTYKVIYQGDDVQKVNTVEKIISDNKEYLELYKTTVEKAYSPYKNIEHYEYEVKVEGNEMTSIVNIDYSKVDTDKLISIDSANASLIKDGKIKKSDMKTLYESVGAICD